MRILITGVTGTLGTEVLKQLQGRGHEIWGLTRQESKFQELSKYCTPVLGDIRDQDSMLVETKNMNIVFHFAALKHVDILEKYYSECLSSNLTATHNIVNAQAINNIARIVFTSTDKAVYPINTYGMCKGLSEKLILLHDSDRGNVVCRYGNVFGSKGSIFERLPKILEETNTISITDARMTRFWVTVKDAATIVINSGLGKDGGLKIPKMKSANVLYMLQYYAKLLGYPNPKIKTIGLRPGEKLHEDLTYDINSDNADRLTDLELEELFNVSSTNRITRQHGQEVSINTELPRD
jgi:FlaA1/EpsC-like NDP-sugar epimerase